MGKLTIKTNNQPRNLLYGCELAPVERAEFDYLDDIDSHDFFRYKGIVYDPGEFMRVPGGCTPDLGQGDADGGPFPGWHGYQSDSYFSGVLIRYLDEDTAGDCDQVIVGRYYS